MYIWRHSGNAYWLDSAEAEWFALAPGRVAIVRRPGATTARVEVFCRSRAEVAKLQRRFGGRAERLARGWERKYLAMPAHAALRVGRRLALVSARTGPRGSRRLRGAGSEALPNELVIPAAGAFGAGEHATTAMSLRLLEEVTRRLSSGWKLFDAGTGTGILALAARRFGAESAVGLDNDARAIAHARANARANRITEAKLLVADVLRWKSRERFDIITANLFSDLIISALPVFRRCLTKSGWLILSGILREQADEVIDSLGKHGFALLQKRRRGKWVALLVRRS